VESFRPTPRLTLVSVECLGNHMQHLVASKTIVGNGQNAVVLEVKGDTVRIKRRGMPDLFLPLDAAAQVARFLLEAAPGRKVPPAT